MRSRIVKYPRARAVALAVGIGALGSCATAVPAMADLPGAGVACKATDGKISGRGSTFQINAVMKSFAQGYQEDVCGPVGQQFAGDPALDNSNLPNDMVAYDYPNSAGNQGSGNGIKSQSCRTEAFGGTDVPYVTTQLQQLDGAPGSLTGGCDITFSPPYTPTPNAAAPHYPKTGDLAASLMTIPVAGGAAGIGIRLPAGTTGCATPGTTINLSKDAMSHIMEGTDATWGAAEITANNPALVGCTTPIIRVVRSDNSGTTQTLKNYLKHVDGSRVLCNGKTWTQLADSTNNWPAPPVPPATACSGVSTINAQSGTNAVVSTTQGNPGAIGYGDLSAWGPNTTNPVILAGVRNATSTAFVTPGTFTGGSNCSIGAKGLPGSTTDDAVGLNGAPSPTTASATWAGDATTVVSDITATGANYPICALTWDMVYPNSGTSLFDNGGPAIAGLTADQNRTLYGFFTYVLSPAAQQRLQAQGYDPLPTTWLDTLRQGFQSDF